MSLALQSGILAALLVYALLRASRSGQLLGFLSGWFEAWLVYRPRWVPRKPTGNCAGCTALWWVGVPAGILAAAHGAGWWGLAVPLVVYALIEKLLTP